MIENIAKLDPMIMGAVGVLVLALIIVSMGLMNSLYGPRARLERRLNTVGGSTGVGGGKGGAKTQSGMKRKDIEAKLKAAEQMKRQQRGYKLQEKLIQAGLKTTPKQFWIYSIICGAVFTILVYVASGIVYTIPAGLLVGTFGIPRFVLRYLVNKRLKAFTANFANAIDLIVRGVKTGMTVAECLSIVGKEMPDPIGVEFRHITESIQMGITLEDCLNRLITRVPTNEARFFTIVLITQQTTGGNLAETLAKLSGILRDRKKMRDKIKALSSEAKIFGCHHWRHAVRGRRRPQLHRARLCQPAHHHQRRKLVHRCRCLLVRHRHPGDAQDDQFRNLGIAAPWSNLE